MPPSPDPAAAPQRLRWWQRAWDAMAPGPEPAPLTRWQHTWRLTLVVLLSLGYLVFLAESDAEPPPSQARTVLRWLDVVAFGVSLWVVQQRRRHPVPVAVGLAAASSVFPLVNGAALLALVSLAARRHLRGLLLVIPLTLVATLIQTWIVWPAPTPPHPLPDAISSLVTIVLISAIAYAIGARRALHQSVMERAAAAEREHSARIAQARAAERTRIAREMHDVLAHRISLVAMHASALNYRTDLSEAERSTALQTIEGNARDALTELRQVLGVLRDPDLAAEQLGSDPEAPQPSLTDLPALVAEASSLGTTVELTHDAGVVPESTGRVAYRIIQEALTNARKHADGAPVQVALTGGDGADLLITVRQPLRTPDRPTAPGAGVGLLGLRERAALVGGSLSAGPDRDGHWVVSARLPCQP